MSQFLFSSFVIFFFILLFRAGYKLTVIDAISDKDWWKGKCFGAVGVFPSNYVTQLHPGEKPLQVTQTVQINATSMQEPPIKLLRDQVNFSYSKKYQFHYF